MYNRFKKKQHVLLVMNTGAPYHPSYNYYQPHPANYHQLNKVKQGYGPPSYIAKDYNAAPYNPAPYNNQPAPYNNQPAPYNNQPAPYNNQPAPYNNQPQHDYEKYPPPVQSKWVDLDKTHRRSNQPNPAVTRSRSSSSVKSKCSVRSNGSTSSAGNFKNSVHIPNMSAGWTSSDSVGKISNSSKLSNNSKSSKISKTSKQSKLKELSGFTDVGRPMQGNSVQYCKEPKPEAQMSFGRYREMAAQLAAKAKAFDGKNNGHINKRTALQHPGLSGSNGSFNNQTFPPEMLSGYGSPMQGPGHIITITLIKTAKGFGFTLLGGDKVGQPILIKSIKKGSSADQQKMLQPYDVLIRVNSTLVNTLNHSQVVAIFKSLPIGTPTYLELRRPGEEMRPKQRSFETQDSSSSQGSLSQPDLLSVYIEKGSSGFGFTIYQSSSGQRVKQILDRKRCAHFAEGDLIIQINEMFVQSKTHTETVNLLKSIPSHSQTLFVIKRSNDDKSQRRRQKSFRSAMRPTAETFAPPPQTAQRYHNPPQPFHDTNPLSQPRQPLAMQPLKDTNISSDYGSSHGGSERLRYETGSDRYGNAGYASSGNERVVEPGEWEDISIQLQRDNNGFGFRIAGGEEFGTQVTIEHVIPEGPADGYLMVFDELRTINGQSVLGSYHSSIVDLVGQAAAYGKLSLVVRRYRNPMMSLTGVNLPDMEQPKYVLKNVRNVTITKKGSECFGFVIQSSLNDETFKIGQIVAGSPAGMNNDLLEDDTVLAVEGTPITGLQHPTVVNMIKKCDTSIELAVATPEIIDQTEFPDFEEQTELVEITLERDEKGFGFSIRGGKDFQQDTLFVLRIGKGGVADRNGLLRRGDEIVEINGQNMKEVCHQDAVDKIKSGGSMLSLIVKRRKLDIPPLIKHGLTDKPDTLKHPDRTHITSHDNELLSSLSNQGSTNLTLDLEGLVLADRDEIRPNNEYDEYELPNQEGELRENTIVDQRDEVVTPSLELEDRGMVVGSGD